MRDPTGCLDYSLKLEACPDHGLPWTVRKIGGLRIPTEACPYPRHLPLPDDEKSFAQDVLRWKELDEKVQRTISCDLPEPLKIPVRVAKRMQQAWEDPEELYLIFMWDGWMEWPVLGI
jgi:hypothetical protein